MIPSLANRLSDNDLDMMELSMEALVKENQLLKQQLHNCFLKVAKTQKVSAHPPDPPLGPIY